MPRSDKFDFSRELIEDMYCTQQLSIGEIARRLGVSHPTISKRIKDYGIQVRPPVNFFDLAPDAPTLTRLIHEEKKTYREIGEHYGVSHGTVLVWVDQMSVARAPRGNAVITKGKPSADALKDLYVTLRKTTRQIGEMFGVRHITVRRWLSDYRIDVRPRSQGLAHRGVTAPTAGELRVMIHIQHLSYQQVGEKYGVDAAAVPHWLTKHGIEKPKAWVTRRKGKEFPLPAADVLRERYESGQSTTSIGKAYGVSASTITKLMDEFGIARRRDGWLGGKRWVCNDGHRVRSSYEQRVDNWLFKHDLPHQHDPALPFGTRHLSDFLVNGTYIEVWGVDKDEQYNTTKEWKRAKYAEFGLPLIEINSWMFSRATWTNRLAAGLLGHMGAPVHVESRLW